MNKDQQRIAVAKWCGWNTEKEVLGSVFVYRDAHGYPVAALPDYLNDRDAIVDVIWDKIVGDCDLEKEFLRQLHAIWGNREDDETICVHEIEMALICSSAEYFCEALLRTVALWKEDE